MMTGLFLIIGAVAAIGLLTLVPKVTNTTARGLIVALAAAVFLGFFTISSFRYVGENQLGVVVKNVGGKSLPPGKIIATGGEKGPQADILPPGWHPWLWPVIYDVELYPVLEIEPDTVGLLSAADGQPLPTDMIYAPEWEPDQVKRMAEDAAYFLGEGDGYKGPQATVLKPGSYRINPKLFKVETVSVTNVEKATVGVVKSNVGEVPPYAKEDSDILVERGERGIWRQPLLPQEYYLHTRAYQVTTVSTAKRVVHYTKDQAERDDGPMREERAITVRSSDGFTFPVDVRVEFEVRPEDAALVVAEFGNDREPLLNRLNSAVRAIFRNNAESVKALDYVQQRSQQESQSLEMLRSEMVKVGVTVTAVRIGDVGDEDTLGPLLKTQTDREIALQEQETFREQQRAAEQKKELTRTEQEAEEEKRLATARYDVQIAEQEKQRRIIEAEAESEAIQIRAQAQADAYGLIAQQIGAGNAALVEILKVVGDAGINITPRVMVSGGPGGEAAMDSQTTALIGTMLDTMISRDAPERAGDRQASGDGQPTSDRHATRGGSDGN